MVFSSAAVLLRQPALRRGAAGAASAGRATFRTSAVPRGGDHAPDYVHAKHMYDIQSVRSFWRPRGWATCLREGKGTPRARGSPAAM